MSERLPAISQRLIFTDPQADAIIIVFIVSAVIALGYVLYAIWSAWRDGKS